MPCPLPLRIPHILPLGRSWLPLGTCATFSHQGCVCLRAGGHNSGLGRRRGWEKVAVGTGRRWEQSGPCSGVRSRGGCVMHGDIICSELCTYGVHGETLCKGPHAHALHRDILCSRVHAYGFPEEVLCSGLHSHVFFSMVHAHIVHGNTQCVACTPFAVECELMWCTRSPIMVPSGVCYGVCPMLVVPGRDLGSAAAPPREVTLLPSPGGSA